MSINYQNQVTYQIIIAKTSSGRRLMVKSTGSKVVVSTAAIATSVARVVVVSRRSETRARVVATGSDVIATESTSLVSTSLVVVRGVTELVTAETTAWVCSAAQAVISVARVLYVLLVSKDLHI